MFVEIHVLQNFAPSNLNRDDTGAPKDCTFGGYRRARISSQCLKRAIRQHFAAAKLVGEDQLAKRTKRISDAVTEILVPRGRSADEVPNVLAALLAAAKIGFKEGKTEYLLYLGSEEIAKLASLCHEHWDTLKAGVKVPKGEENGKKKAAKDVKKEAKDSLPAELQEAVLDVFGSGKSVDLALFGRMLADMPEKNVDAASQVAHAISTNEVAMEMDFYTAVDDLRPEDTQGADMMGVVEFNSSCFYRYAKLDLEKLTENLGGDQRLARKTTLDFIRSSIAAVPTGKQNSMAAHNPPSYVRVLVRDGGEAWNLANAFLKPVRPGRLQGSEAGEDLAQLSIRCLEGHLVSLRRMYGGEGVRGDHVASLYDERTLTIGDLLAKTEASLS
ncbi:MAG TPA: type I-E CRISPR-associated protein Cas7/Cse4/CasC [Anaeromyxobacter sp.]|nr:type I-E CRISPR-associated protein Cas7/Cse4/CasC [Anaeromyxobacter sp.]